MLANHISGIISLIFLLSGVGKSFKRLRETRIDRKEKAAAGRSLPAWSGTGERKYPYVS
jgi:hypothetical protein